MSFDRTARYLTNTQFTQLVQSGWIGSVGVASDTIAELIAQSLAEDRSLVAAWTEAMPAQEPAY